METPSPDDAASGAERAARHRVPTPAGLPFRFDLNRTMVAGIVLALAGAAMHAAHWAGAWDASSPLYAIGYGVVLGGIALYFVGRVVQIVAEFRRR